MPLKTDAAERQIDIAPELVAALKGQLAELDQAVRRKSLRLEEHDDPAHPVVAAAKARIEELAAQRAALEEQRRRLESRSRTRPQHCGSAVCSSRPCGPPENGEDAMSRICARALVQWTRKARRLVFDECGSGRSSPPPCCLLRTRVTASRKAKARLRLRRDSVLYG
jgi:hypothetical protein